MCIDRIRPVNLITPSSRFFFKQVLMSFIIGFVLVAVVVSFVELHPCQSQPPVSLG
jgi:hypothetical protein